MSRISPFSATLPAWTAAAALAGCAWSVGPLAAQEAVARFASGVQLVEVYVTVVDERNAPVTDLHETDFEVYENGERQEIAAFAAGEFPLTAALGVDRSWSMAGEPLRLAKLASRSFLRQLRPSDRAVVVAIGRDTEVVAPITMSRREQEGAIAALEPWSTTSLHDAIIAMLDRLDPEPGRQALVVFSDGADRYSRASAAEVIERARRSHALVYPIAFGKTRPPLLAELAVLTGGRSFLLRDAGELEKTLETIARELRHQYLIGYTPSDRNEALGGWRSIEVKLKPERRRLRVRARDGYLVE